MRGFDGDVDDVARFEGGKVGAGDADVMFFRSAREACGLEEGVGEG